MEMFWAKVFFKEFIKHYRKMNDEQMAADVNASMDALEDLDGSGESFGAKMVRWSMERAEEPFAIAARENGKKGGRPRKDEQRTGGDSGSVGNVASPAVRHIAAGAPVRLPSWPDFLQYVNSNNIDYTDAREWFEMSIVDRDGKDREGNTIKNWKAALKAFCRAKAEGRRKTA